MSGVTVPAIVLVGGEGTRLRPLTCSVPKQLLPVAGIPLLRRVLQPLEDAGVKDVILSMGYRSESFAELELGPFRITHAVEDTPLGSGGGLAHAVRGAGITGTFIALNGDVIGDVEITSMLRTHRESGADATILLKAVPDPTEFGVALLSEDGNIARFIEKPRAPAPSNLINAGAWVLETSILDGIPEGGVSSIEREIFPALATAGRLRGILHEGWWHDVGRLDRYLAANQECVERCLLPEGWTVREGSLLAPDAVVDPLARVGRSVVGVGARVGSGAVVEDSVLLDGSSVGPGATVHRSVLGPGWSVGEADVVTDAICAEPGRPDA